MTETVKQGKRLRFSLYRTNMLFVIFEGLDQETRGIILGILNRDPAAYVKLSLTRFGTVFAKGKIKHGVLPRRAVLQSLRGVPFQNQTRSRSGEIRIIDVPEINRKKRAQAKLIRGIESWRGLPLAQLKQIFGPKLWRCRRCGNFFEAANCRRRRYCSAKCGHNETARKAVYRARSADQTEKLHRVRAALKNCPQGCDQKAWIAKRAGVSKNWITYAAARGEIKL